MFTSFYCGLQQDIKLFLIPPVLCALFRLVFIVFYGQYPFSTAMRQWKKFYHCFRYGFWWGMDWFLKPQYHI